MEGGAAGGVGQWGVGVLECWRESQPQANSEATSSHRPAGDSEEVPKELHRVSPVQSVWIVRLGAVLRNARPLLGCFEQLARFLLCLGAGRVLDGCLEQIGRAACRERVQ